MFPGAMFWRWIGAPCILEIQVIEKTSHVILAILSQLEEEEREKKLGIARILIDAIHGWGSAPRPLPDDEPVELVRGAFRYSSYPTALVYKK